jgi:hypothetical protein
MIFNQVEHLMKMVNDLYKFGDLWNCPLLYETSVLKMMFVNQQI